MYHNGWTPGSGVSIEGTEMPVNNQCLSAHMIANAGWRARRLSLEIKNLCIPCG